MLPRHAGLDDSTASAAPTGMGTQPQDSHEPSAAQGLQCLPVSCWRRKSVATAHLMAREAAGEEQRWHGRLRWARDWRCSCSLCAVTLGAAALVRGSWWWLLVDPHTAEGEK